MDEEGGVDGFDDELASVDGGEDGAAGEPVEGWGKVEAEGGFRVFDDNSSKERQREERRHRRMSSRCSRM